MQPSTDIIDSHVHFYTAHDLERVAGSLPYSLPEPHPLSAYLDRLIDAGLAPTLLNNVHLSILPDSENVFASFAELQSLQARDPARYGAIRLVGTLKADPAYATRERLAHPQVVGARIVLHDAAPHTVSEGRFNDAHWQAFYTRLLPRQHLHVYAMEAETNLRVLRQIPPAITVVIDHLGSCHGERGADEPAYVELLTLARQRGNVWFKGPGYRTSTDPHTCASFAAQIVRLVGVERLLLEASDAPHVGCAADGSPYRNLFDPLLAMRFTHQVAQHTSTTTQIPASQLLRGASGLLAV